MSVCAFFTCGVCVFSLLLHVHVARVCAHACVERKDLVAVVYGEKLFALVIRNVFTVNHKIKHAKMKAVTVARCS